MFCGENKIRKGSGHLNVVIISNKYLKQNCSTQANVPCPAPQLCTTKVILIIIIVVIKMNKKIK